MNIMTKLAHLRMFTWMRARIWGRIVTGALVLCPPVGIVGPQAPKAFPPKAPIGAVVMLASSTEKAIKKVSIGGIRTFVRGEGTSHLITIPAGLAECPYNVDISYVDGSTDRAHLNVESAVGPLVPVLKPPVEYVKINNSGDVYLLVYGAGFDTSSEIWIDNKPIETFSPGFEAKRGQPPATIGLYSNCDQKSWVDCSFIAGSILGARIKISDIRKGAGVEVRSALTGLSTGVQPLAIPARALSLRVRPSCTWSTYRIDAPAPPQMVLRQHELSTVRRVLGPLGYLVELQAQDPPGDDKCNDFCGSHCESLGTLPDLGPGYTMADLINILASPSGLSNGNNWLLTGVMLSYFIDEGSPCLDVYGLRPPNVDGFAVFTSTFTRGRYSNDTLGSGVLSDLDGVNTQYSIADSRSLFLRTFLHELGHGLGLTHCQGDKGHISLMNQDSCLDQANWAFNFSSEAEQILKKSATSSQLPQVSAASGEIGQSECLCTSRNPPPKLENANQVRFELELPDNERSVELGTPISVIATVYNSGSEPITVARRLDPTYGFVTYDIKKDGDDKVQVFRPYFQLDAAASSISLPRGGGVSAKVPLFCGAEGYLFQKPGKYVIQGHFHGVLSSFGLLDIPSNTVELEVKSDPAYSSLEAVMASPGGCLLVLAGGGDTLPLREAAGKLEKLLQHPPANQLASYAHLALGEYFRRGAPSLPDIPARSSDYQRAYDQFTKVRENDLGGFFPLHLLSGRIETSIETRNFGGVGESLEQLQRRGVGDLDALPYLDKTQKLIDKKIDRKRLKVNDTRLRHQLESLGCDRSAFELVPDSVEVMAAKGDLVNASEVEIDPLSLDALQGSSSKGDAVRLSLLPIAGALPTPTEVSIRLPQISRPVTVTFQVDLEKFKGFEVSPKAFSKTIPVMATCLQDLSSLERYRFTPTAKDFFIASGKRRAKVGVELEIPASWLSKSTKISETVTVSRP